MLLYGTMPPSTMPPRCNCSLSLCCWLCFAGPTCFPACLPSCHCPSKQGVSARNQVIMVQQCQAFAAGCGSAEASIILDPNMVTLTGHGSGMLPGKSLQRTARQDFICGVWTTCQHERLRYLLFVHQHDSRGSGPPSTVACRCATNLAAVLLSLLPRFQYASHAVTHQPLQLLLLLLHPLQGTPMLSFHAFNNALLLLLLLSPLPAYLPCFRSQACIRHFLCCVGRSTIPTPKARIRGGRRVTGN